MTAIVILGVFRSGTSATTRALGLLGASLGPPANLGMFWENGAMRRPNERLLQAFGGGWECPPVLEDGWERTPAAQALIPEARAALAEYGSAPVFVWKDPRTSLTLPFWLGLLDEPPVVVFIHRHPLEVAASQQTRDGLGPAHSFALWERYNGDSLRHAVGLRTVVLGYAGLLAAPEPTMRTLVDALDGWGVRLPNDPDTTDLELTPKRRHHHAEAGVFEHPVATPSQRELFSLIPTFNGVSDSFALPGSLPEASPLSRELLDVCAQLHRARHETRRSQADLRRLAGSRKRLLRQIIENTLPGRGPQRDGAARSTSSA